MTPQATVPLVIFHADCNDGLTAAWVIRTAYASIGRQVELYPAKYQTPPPDVTGRTVIIADFSYKRPVLLEMLEKAERIEIYDHHKTAQEDIADLEHEKLLIVFDMERSGAGIAWDEFMVDPHSGDELPRPWFVNYVEHNDLWRHSNPKYDGVMPDCKAVMEYIRSYPTSHHFTMYDLWYECHQKETRDVPIEVPAGGKAILRAKQVMVEQALTIAHEVTYPTVGPLLVCNVPFFLASEVGHALAERNKERYNLPFGVTYYHKKEGVIGLSFRSIGEYDVSALAIVKGGGGHRNAAGADVDALPWENLEPEQDILY